MKRTRLRTASPKAKIWRQLDKLCRELVVEIRDRNTCQRCGKTAEQSQIHWAHIEGRGAKSIQHNPFNSLALCAGCHLHFDGPKRKELREEWWAVKWPARATMLAVWRASRPPKLDPELTRKWLENQIATHRFDAAVFPTEGA